MSQKLATKEYVDNEVSKVITINITSEATLNKAVSENQGRMLILIPQNSITINGITIRAWSHIFISNAFLCSSIGKPKESFQSLG